jgi:hypothetical protein
MQNQAVTRFYCYNVDFPEALTLAHRARAISPSRALTAGLMRRSFFLEIFSAGAVAFFGAVPLTLAQRARAAAPIFARAAADIARFPVVTGADGV